VLCKYTNNFFSKCRDLNLPPDLLVSIQPFEDYWLNTRLAH
jgi:hypothetical protein